MTSSQRLRNQRGTSTLEFVVVLPVLLLIFIGSMEVSRAWLTANVVTSAVREGARIGAVTTPAANVGTVAEARINEILAAAGLTASSGPTVGCINPSPCEPNSQVVADVTVTFQTIVPAFIPALSSIPIHQTATMRYE